MTTTQQNALEIERKQQADKETKRHNRHQEVAGYVNAVGNLAKGAGSVMSSLTGGRGLKGFTGKQDPEWYMGVDSKTESLNADSTNWCIGYGYPIEMPYVDGERATLDIPGVVTADFIPVCGNSTSFNAARVSPVNQAFNELFTRIRNTAAGKNYEYADLAIYTLGAVDIFAALAYARRVLTLRGKFSAENAYYGTALIHALHFDAQDIRRNGALYVSRYNDLVNRMVWAVPSTMPLLKRRIWLNTMILSDVDASKTQYYLYVQKCFLKYNDVKGQLDAYYWYQQLNQKPGQDPVCSMSDFLDMIDDMMNRFANSTDASIINADIIRSFGESGTAGSVIPYLDENECPLITIEANALEQFHNSVPIGFALANQATTGIKQVTDPNAESFGVFYDDLATNPLNKDSKLPHLSSHLLRWSYPEAPDTGNTYEITRFIPEVSGYTDPDEAGTRRIKIESYGTELLLSLSIYSYAYHSGVSGDWDIKYLYIDSPIKGVSGLFGAAEFMHKASVFSYMPYIQLATGIAFQNGNMKIEEVFPGLLINTDNVAILENKTLRNLHLRAVRSEYMTPNFMSKDRGDRGNRPNKNGKNKKQGKAPDKGKDKGEPEKTPPANG